MAATTQHAVTSVPDARKGESLLLVTTRRDVEVRDILAFARERGVPELAVPRSVLTVGALPLLATGKVDYPAVGRMMDETRATQALEPANT